MYVKLAFLREHPIQPEATEELPFNHSKVFFNKQGTEQISRKWISYSASTSSLYCTSCMCFDRRSESPFVSGLNVKGRKDLYDAIHKHENSVSHRDAMSAHVAALAGKDIGKCINEDMASKSVGEREQRRAVVERIVDLVLFIGTQGIAFRGSKDEGIETLHDRSVNHGNFLELALLVANYDPVLKAHIDHCVSTARQRKKSGTNQQGRGSIISFMSKTSINKIIRIIGSKLQLGVASEVKDAGIFSIEMDSTQDIAVLDQLAIIVRYVSPNGTQEKLLRLVISHDGTGLGLHKKLKEVLESLGLDIKNIVACSFDGAGNMSGIFKGLQARIKEDNPNLLFTHCAGHCLNLVLTATSESCNAAKSLFGLVESGAVFLGESYKRMDAWVQRVTESNAGHQKLRRLRKIGKTRWWGKPKALGSVIDANGKDTNRIIDFLMCMEDIRTSKLFDSSASFTAQSLRENWCKFETILLAFVMMHIYEHSTPVSTALQSSGIDYLVTFAMVQSLIKKIDEMHQKFDFFVERTKKYAEVVNCKLSELEDEECGEIPFRVETDFALTRRSRRTAANDRTPEQLLQEAADSFRINVYLEVVNFTAQGLRDRFTPNEELLRDCALLDPKRYPGSDGDADYVDEDDEIALCTVAKLAKVDARRARIELNGFSRSYTDLAVSVSACNVRKEADLNLAGFLDLDVDDVDADDAEAEAGEEMDDLDEVDVDGLGEKEHKHKAKCEACGKCLACALLLFLRTPVLQSAYPRLFAIFKFVMTVPTTQVACERMFSKLKIIKNRLRNSLSQALLEPLLFINVERLAALSLDKEEIINEFARSSTLMQKLLL